MNNTRLLDAQEVAKRLGLTVHQVYRRIQRGDLPYELGGHNGTKYLVAATAVDDYIRAGQPLSRNPKQPPLMRVSDVAEVTGLSKHLVRQLCHRGILEAIRGDGPNAHLRITRASVERFLTPTISAHVMRMQ